MPQTTVRTPDGNTVTVNHPEGATDEQIIAYARENYSPPEQTARSVGDQFTGLSESSGMNFLAGIGKGFVDLGRGVQQRGLDVFGMLPENRFSEGARQRQEELRRDEALTRERDAPLRATKAGLAGEITGNIAATLPFGLGAGTIPRAMALGAAEGAALPTVSSDETAFNIGAGGLFGAGGQLASRGVSRLLNPVTRNVSDRLDDAVNLLRREGVDLDVGQRTGSGGAQKVRSFLADNPLTYGRQADFADRQGRQFTRAVLRTAGIDGDELTPKLLNGALDDVGNLIDDAAVANPARFDSQFAADLQMIRQSIPGSVGDEGAQRALIHNMDRLISSVDARGQIPGGIFTKVRSDLSKLSTKTPVAREIQEAMLDSLQRSGGDPEKLRKAIAQYRNIQIIQNATDLGVDKTISPLKLSSTLNNRRNRTLYQRRLGHPTSVRLAELAEAGRSILPQAFPDSGTAGRRFTGEMILGASGLGAGLATGQDVGDAALMGVGAMGLPYLLQRGLLSQGAAGNYLAQGAGTSVPPMIEALIRQGIISGGVVGGK